MVYSYKRKTDRASWSEENLQKAMQEAKKTSTLKASKIYGIPYATLHRHMSKGTSKKKLGRFETIFSPEEEEILLKYTHEMDSLFYGLTRPEFMKIAGDFAKVKGKSGVFSGNIAGKGWFKNFKLRHPTLTLRSPEPTSLARVKGFNREAVNRFYSLLEEVIEKYAIPPDMIFNMDETGVRTSSTKPPKVLSTCGKKQVGIVSSNEKGVLTTVVCCCSATGSFIPPYFIFKRKRFNSRLLDGAPPGSEATVTNSGWINSEKFLDWLKMFVQKVRPTENNKALLILDNHESHKSYEALEFAKKNHVIFLSIPPHTSHKLQPLDVAVYGPIKKFFEIEVNNFQKQHPGRIINQYDIAKLFTGAYLKGAVPTNAISGFRASGIHPFNGHIFGDQHFAPSEIYKNKNINENEQIIENENEESQQSTSEDKNEPNNEAIAQPANVSDMDLLQNIRPIPIGIVRKSTRGRKSQQSEILTSSSIITTQKQKKDTAAAKRKAPIDAPGPSGVKRQRQTKKALGKSMSSYLCTVCKEKYVDPPREDWIQCGTCQEWTHEACSSYSGRGSYFCDDCFD